MPSNAESKFPISNFSVARTKKRESSCQSREDLLGQVFVEKKRSMMIAIGNFNHGHKSHRKDGSGRNTTLSSNFFTTSTSSSAYK